MVPDHSGGLLPFVNGPSVPQFCSQVEALSDTSFKGAAPVFHTPLKALFVLDTECHGTVVPLLPSQYVMRDSQPFICNDY